jgi:hypothetical protein
MCLLDSQIALEQEKSEEKKKRNRFSFVFKVLQHAPQFFILLGHFLASLCLAVKPHACTGGQAVSCPSFRISTCKDGGTLNHQYPDHNVDTFIDMLITMGVKPSRVRAFASAPAKTGEVGVKRKAGQAVTD